MSECRCFTSCPCDGCHYSAVCYGGTLSGGDGLSSFCMIEREKTANNTIRELKERIAELERQINENPVS